MANKHSRMTNRKQADINLANVKKKKKRWTKHIRGFIDTFSFCRLPPVFMTSLVVSREESGRD